MQQPQPASLFSSLDHCRPAPLLLRHLHSYKSSWQINSWDFGTPCFAKFLILAVHQNLSPGTTEDCLEESRGDPSLTMLFPHCMGRTCLGSSHICCNDQLDLWFCGILLEIMIWFLFTQRLSLLLTNSKRISDVIFTKGHRI